MRLPLVPADTLALDKSQVTLNNTGHEAQRRIWPLPRQTDTVLALCCAPTATASTHLEAGSINPCSFQVLHGLVQHGLAPSHHDDLGAVLPCKCSGETHARLTHACCSDTDISACLQASQAVPS